ncbi:sulfite exporter TauE/SafE family protein [Intrasporangium sp.]|jgi:uncharacterized membrane protein YfcA|uniref:sulfite exporter TauE/SafE family protein n=1 Tax=Intrasporangium sp. TaxID=1925024 RepID=UPI00336574B6
MLLYALPLGLAIGVTLGALGGGGAIIAVPALVYVLGQDPRTATTSSLVIVGLTSLIAVVPHARAGRVRFVQGLTFGVLGTVGSVAGSALSASVPQSILLKAFAALMLLVAALMFRRASRAPRDLGRAIDPAVEPMFTVRPFACACPRVAKVVVAATAVGLITGFFGVGGGFALVPALVLALGFPMPAAVGTSLLVIAINSATALTTRLGSGSSQLDWTLIGTFTGAAILGSLLGGRIASRANPRHLTIAFAILLVLVAAYMAIRPAA